LFACGESPFLSPGSSLPVFDLLNDREHKGRRVDYMDNQSVFSAVQGKNVFCGFSAMGNAQKISKFKHKKDAFLANSP